MTAVSVHTYQVISRTSNNRWFPGILSCIERCNVKRVLLFILGGILVLAASAACSSSETPKTAVVDVTRVIKESDNGKKASAELDALVKAKQATVNEKAAVIDKLKKELESSTLAMPAKKAKEEEINRLTAEAQKLIAQSQTDVQKKAGELRNGLVQEIRGIVEKIGQEEKYLTIQTAENVAYFQKDIDITEKVIKQYNESQQSPTQ